MSIAAIITRGYGDFGSIPEITTAGYIAITKPSGGKRPKKRDYTEDERKGLEAVYGGQNPVIVEPEPVLTQVIEEPEKNFEERDKIIAQADRLSYIERARNLDKEQEILTKLEEEQEILLILALTQQHVSR